MNSQPPAFLEDRGGASAPEYALVLAGMATAVVVGLVVFGSSIGNGLMASSHYVDQVALNFGSAQTASAGAAAASPSLSASAPGRSAAAATAGRSASAPGHGGSSPGKSGNAPGKNK